MMHSGQRNTNTVNPTCHAIHAMFAPPSIAPAGLGDARDSQGWTRLSPSPTLSAKIFSVSPRISIGDRANMAISLKGQTVRTKSYRHDETLFGREKSFAHDTDGSRHRS